MRIVEHLVPEVLWELFQHVVPQEHRRSQLGDQRQDDREMLAALVFVATSDCAWQQLPTSAFATPAATAHRVFRQWSQDGVWPQLQRLALAEPSSRHGVDWARSAVAAMSQRATNPSEGPTVRPLSELTVDELERWDRTVDETYWAGEGSPLRRSYTLRLPGGTVHAPGVLPVQKMSVWVDPVDNWIWVELPRAAEAWYPLGASTDRRLLLRRGLEECEASVYLDQLLPSPDQYPVEEDLAVALRAGGWMPDDLPPHTPLWWRLETVEDATALALRPRAWWTENGWPMHPVAPQPDRTGASPHPASDLPAPMGRDLAVLLEHRVPVGLVAEFRKRGHHDVRQLLTITPPSIPDNATCVEFRPPAKSGHRPKFALTTASARTIAQEETHRWLDPVIITTTPIWPLHVSQFSVIWSDGSWAPGLLRNPEHESAPWPSKNRRLGAVAGFLYTAEHATNWPELCEQRVWMAWLDAEGSTSTDITEEFVDAHPRAEGTMTLIRHTVHCVEGTDINLWQVTPVTEVSEWARPYTLHTTEAEAHAVIRLLQKA